MRRSRWAVALVVGGATVAVAGMPMNVPDVVRAPVGWTTTVQLSAPAAQVTVAKPDLVQVTVEGRKVLLHGRSAGVTEATVRTRDGGTVTFRVYVASTVKDEKDRVYWWTP